MNNKKLTLEQLNKRIEKSNEKFASMTPAQKRVEIAYDCMARLSVGQLTGNQGNICRFETKESDSWGDRKEIDVNQKDNIQELLKKGIECSVCAKGGLLMSYVGRVNEFKVGNLSNTQYHDGNLDDVEYNTVTDGEHTKLLELFDVHQLALIETVFEDEQCLRKDAEGKKIVIDEDGAKDYRNELEEEYVTYSNQYDEEDHEIDEVKGFVKFDEDSFILYKICENIIENEGTFILK